MRQEEGLIFHLYSKYILIPTSLFGLVNIYFVWIVNHCRLASIPCCSMLSPISWESTVHELSQRGYRAETSMCQFHTSWTESRWDNCCDMAVFFRQIFFKVALKENVIPLWTDLFRISDSEADLVDAILVQVWDGVPERVHRLPFGHWSYI